jgi:hypothetical protein
MGGWKLCLKSLVIGEMQIKTIMRYYYNPIRMDEMKSLDHTKGWQGYRSGIFIHPTSSLAPPLSSIEA